MIRNKNIVATPLFSRCLTGFTGVKMILPGGAAHKLWRLAPAIGLHGTLLESFGDAFSSF